MGEIYTLHQSSFCFLDCRSKLTQNSSEQNYTCASNLFCNRISQRNLYDPYYGWHILFIRARFVFSTAKVKLHKSKNYTCASILFCNSISQRNNGWLLIRARFAFSATEAKLHKSKTKPVPRFSSARGSALWRNDHTSHQSLNKVSARYLPFLFRASASNRGLRK